MALGVRLEALVEALGLPAVQQIARKCPHILNMVRQRGRLAGQSTRAGVSDSSACMLPYRAQHWGRSFDFGS